MKEKYGVIILAGGRSERMDFPKMFLKFLNKLFIQYVSEVYSNAGIKNIGLVVNKDYTEGKWKELFNLSTTYISFIEKTDPHFGRFHSIKLGISKLLDCDYVFIQNIDNPYIDKELVLNLLRHKCPFGYTQAFYQGRKGHPVLISNIVCTRISEDRSSENDLRDILKEFPKTDVEINDKRILANVNTKKEYEEYISEWA